MMQTTQHTDTSGSRGIRGRLARKCALGTALAAAMLAGCASLAPTTPEEQVRARATERWQALVAYQMDKAYAFTTPAYRAVTSFERDRARYGSAVQWLGAEVIRVNCEPEKCIVRVRIDVKPIVPGLGRKTTLSTHADETWLLVDGQWWLHREL